MKSKTLALLLCVFLTFISGCGDKTTDRIAFFYNDYKDEQYADSLRIKIDKALSETENINSSNYNAKSKQAKQQEQIKEEIEKALPKLKLRI